MSKYYPVIATLLCVTLITLLNLAYLHQNLFNLYVDEAQYWNWAQEPAFGYYSKPPMIAWLIMLTTNFCGDNEFCIRLSSPFLHATTALVIFFIARELYHNATIAFWSAITYITLPAVIVSSAIISTDPPLMLFWSLCLFFFIKALRSDSIFWWLLTGIAGGLGCLSKYNMIIFIPSALLFLLLAKNYGIRNLKSGKFLVAAAIAAIIYLPNLLWNINNHFVSYAHTNDISGLGKKLFHPEQLALFTGAQAGVFGPILFGLLLWIFGQALRRSKTLSEEDKLLLCFTVPFFVIIATISFLSKANANWAAPMYVAATILVVAYAHRHAKMMLIYISLGVHLLIATLYYNYTHIRKLTGMPQMARTGNILARDPFYRVKGWKELGSRVSLLMKNYPNATLLLNERDMVAEMLYYMPTKTPIKKWVATEGVIKDHYDLTRPLGRKEGGEFIFITRYTGNNIAETLHSSAAVIPLNDIVIPLYTDYQLRYSVYYLKRE
jgi:4-amino-4-deoxy-L-arabinose transferase-like glycosyltransferase